MLPTIAGLAGKHNIKPLKKYGQNFIFDESLCDKIVKYSGLKSGEYVVEIGPGPAGLSRSILKMSPAKLTVIETDERIIPLLNEIRQYYPALEVKYMDALKLKLKELNSPQKLHIIANLPYNIGTKLLTDWLWQIDQISSMTLMLQKEVVERINARSETKLYGRLSVICQIICNVEKCFDVSPKAFYPEPKIWSSIVHLKPKSNIPNRETLNKVEHITRLAFNSRRKMLKSSLKNLTNQDIEQKLASLNINPQLRAENLTPEDYLKIAKSL